MNPVYFIFVLLTLASAHPFKGLKSFSWSDCDGSTSPAKFTNFSIQPDPITLPGDITISAELVTTQNATSPLKCDIIAKRKVRSVWVKIPCIDGVGSCSYDDGCQLLYTFFPSQQCPPPFIENNIPCHCPIAAGSYSFPTSYFYVSDYPPLPSWLTDGEYQAEIKLQNNGEPLFCLQVQFTLASPTVQLSNEYEE